MASSNNLRKLPIYDEYRNTYKFDFTIEGNNYKWNS